VAVNERGGGGVGISGAGRARDTGITVRLPDIPLWVPADAQAVINDLAIDTIRLAMQEVAGAVSGEAPVDSGQLAQSFTADPATQTGGLELLGTNLATGVTGRIFSTLPHAIVMDLGRRAGQPINRAGIDAIGLWAQRKLGLSASAAASAKWAIAQAIVAHGIEGTHYVEAGLNKARPTVDQLFAALGASVSNALLTKTGKRRNVNLGKALGKAKRN
jgi:hypothetical protein